MATKSLPEGFTGIWIPSELYLHVDLNGADRELLGAICSFHKHDSTYTSIGYLADLFGVDKSNIRKRVTKLEKSGFLVRDNRNNETGGSNLISPTPKCYGFTDIVGCAQAQAVAPTPQAKAPTPTGENAYPPQAKTPTDNKYNNKQDNKQNNKKSASDVAQNERVGDGFFEPDFKDWFEQTFWKRYPKRKDKSRAYKALLKQKPDEQVREKIIEGLSAQIQERKLKSSVGEWVPEWKHPSTWINGKNWEDDVELTAKEQPKHGKQQKPMYQHGTWEWYKQEFGWACGDPIIPGEGPFQTEDDLYREWFEQYGHKTAQPQPNEGSVIIEGELC